MRIDQARPLAERFWEKVDRSGDCWNWTGMADAQGYGRIRIGSRSDGSRRLARAPRVAYELEVGKIPSGKLVLHHCDNPRCVRPSHLYVGSAADNMRDMAVRHRHPKRRQTHCIHGHRFTVANTYLRSNGTRACQRCRRTRERRRKVG